MADDQAGFKRGLLIRDPMRFSDYTLIIPPSLLHCLEYFDGRHTGLDLREFLVRASGQLDVGGVVDHFKSTTAANNQAYLIKLQPGQTASISFGNEYVPGTLELKSFTPTPTGFTVTFWAAA